MATHHVSRYRALRSCAEGKITLLPRFDGDCFSVHRMLKSAHKLAPSRGLHVQGQYSRCRKERAYHVGTLTCETSPILWSAQGKSGEIMLQASFTWARFAVAPPAADEENRQLDEQDDLL